MTYHLECMSSESVTPSCTRRPAADAAGRNAAQHSRRVRRRRSRALSAGVHPAGRRAVARPQRGAPETRSSVEWVDPRLAQRYRQMEPFDLGERAW